MPNVLTRPVHVAPEGMDPCTQPALPEPQQTVRGPQPSHAVGPAWFTGRSEPKPQEHPGIRYAQSSPQSPQTLLEQGGLEHASVSSSSEPAASVKKATRSVLGVGRHFVLTRGLESGSLSSARTLELREVRGLPWTCVPRTLRAVPSLGLDLDLSPQPGCPHTGSHSTLVGPGDPTAQD